MKRSRLPLEGPRRFITSQKGVMSAWLLAASSLETSAAGAQDAARQAELQAAAQSSVRPSWCAADSGFWHSRAVLRVRDCATLALGYTCLTTEPARASSLAQLLLKERPKDRDALVLDARAHAMLGDFQEALQRFEGAGFTSAQQIIDVSTLHDYARSLRALSKPESADAYRLLLPRAAGLTVRGGRRLIAIAEGALTVMRQSREGAAEAVRFLRPHLEQSLYYGGEELARLTLNLALDRKGAVIAEQREAGSAFEPRSAWKPVLLSHELLALQAIAQGADSVEARATWQAYLEAAPADDPFREHAERRLKEQGP